MSFLVNKKFQFETIQFQSFSKHFLNQVLLKQIFYGIGSKWREQLSRQILDYNERGVMMMLKNKWWKKTPQTESVLSLIIFNDIVFRLGNARKKLSRSKSHWGWTKPLEFSHY